MLSNAESITVVKGSLAQDFLLLAFSWIWFLRAPEYPIRAISNLYDNWRIYLQLDFGDKLYSRFTDVNDTGDKLFTGVNDTSDKTVGQISVCLHHEMNVLEKIII